MQNSVTVFAPATVANVGCGFDIFGLALEKPGDRVVARRSSTPGVTITAITGDDGKLPRDAHKNTAGVAVHELLIAHGDPAFGVELELHKDMPIGSGLGSSAASSVAAVVAANELLGNLFTRRDLLPFVMAAEKEACGAAHADNVAPSLLGGFILIRSYDPLDVISLPIPRELYVAVIHPDIELRTDDARAVMKSHLTLSDAVEQFGNTAGLVAGLFREDYELIGKSLHDVVAEPHRSLLIPGFQEVKKAALTNGALGFSISGSGPSVFAFCRGKETAEKVAHAVHSTFKSTMDLTSQFYVSPINPHGAQRID